DRHALQLRENYLCALSPAGNPVHVSKSRQSSRFSHVLVLRKMNAFFEFGNCFVLLTHRKKRESKPFMSSGICAEIGIRPVCPPIFPSSIQPRGLGCADNSRLESMTRCHMPTRARLLL